MKKWIPLTIIVILMLIAYFSGLTDYLTFDNIKEHREKLLTYIAHYPMLAPFLFILIYIVTVTLSIPAGAVLSLIGGFLFGVPLSTFYVTIAATIGATFIFLAARTALGDLLKKKAGPFLSKMEAGFQKNATSYLLFLRFIPLFPFWLVNLAPSFFNVKTRTYLWTTFIGIIPGAYVYTQAGSGLGAIFDQGKEFSIKSVLNIEIRLALILLALFALIPTFVRRLKNAREKP
ncbi:TVP38/TMEM64 family protein [Candidatus Neptunochlamydia vexilliferae]|uniref:TVP38/TMEM64 family protein n=1 Tax=Candidatus Neptunichlamydia vexilliferae TaxID=1651774 RepID=UPI001890D286|nr:TVP38/TMEM64 family protein [Candidatus Neptunochlamydia vexilliferae]